jgi:hypothetical protein
LNRYARDELNSNSPNEYNTNLNPRNELDNFNETKSNSSPKS